jgi:antitoxin component YwqK of YwqJK toxin-antitoxin module
MSIRIVLFMCCCFVFGSMFSYGNSNDDSFTIRAKYWKAKTKACVFIEIKLDQPVVDSDLLDSLKTFQNHGAEFPLLGAAIYKNGKPWKAIADFNSSGTQLPSSDCTNGNGTWFDYFPSGKKSMTGPISSGLKNGEWFYYYENGTVSRQGKYQQGVREGSWQFYAKQGKKSHELNYRNGVVHGPYKHFHANGQLKTEGFVQRAIDGVERKSSSFFTSTNFQDRSYKEFKAHGRWQFYYDNGQLRNEVQYNNGELWAQGHCYTKNGTALESGTLAGGTGTVTEYNEQGHLTKSYGLKDQLLDGEEKLFNTKGEVIQLFTFKNGEKNGKFTAVSKDNRFYYEGHYSDNLLHGPYQKEDRKEKLVWEQNYQYGKLHGISKTYNKGVIIEASEFYAGRRSGKFKEYYKNGAIRKIFHLKNDTIVGTTTQYYANGQVSSLEEWNEAERYPNYTSFYEDGTKRSESFPGSGIHRNYYTNGNMMSEVIPQSGSDSMKTIYKFFKESGPLDYTYYRQLNKVWGGEMKAYYKKKKYTISKFYGNGKIDSTLVLKGTTRYSGKLTKYKGNGNKIRRNTDMEFSGTFVDGRQDGLFTYYGPKVRSGFGRASKKPQHKDTLVTFNNGIRHGDYSSFIKGKLYEKGKYENGKRIGEWKQYSTVLRGKGTTLGLGNTYAIGNYVNGLKEGDWKAYTLEDKPTGKIYVFKAGKQIAIKEDKKG